MSLTYNGTG